MGRGSWPSPIGAGARWVSEQETPTTSLFPAAFSVTACVRPTHVQGHLFPPHHLFPPLSPFGAEVPALSLPRPCDEQIAGITPYIPSLRYF